MAIEIVDFPIKKMVIFHWYVSSPEGGENSYDVFLKICFAHWRMTLRSFRITRIADAYCLPTPLFGVDFL